MRKKLSGLLFILFFFAHHMSCFASHIYGGELLYTHLTGNSYKVTITLYGDCAASSTIFNTLYTATPLIYLINGGTVTDTFSLKPDTVGIEVSPVCPSQLSNTSCNGGTLPGVKKFIYTDTITVPGTSANWQFVFNGNLGAASAAGRSNNITNIVAAGSTVMDLEADLNNTSGQNSSPQYSTIPTPFYCINILEQYNQGAVDPDGDSLAFSLVPGIDGNTSSSVGYISPYTATDPLATDSSGFNFNGLNGQMSFTPSILQDGLVVCKVSEYRNGVLVGTSEREMTFVVLNNCTNSPPNLSITNLVGGEITGTTASQSVINMCVGTPDLSFALALNNPDGDTTTISNTELPGAATLNISNNNTTNPSLSFNWATGSVPAGIYTFFVTLKNDFCPISSTQTIAYTINITAIPTLSATLLDPTQCVHQAYMEYNLAGGFLPRTLTITQNGNSILSYTDTTGTIKDSLPTGTYTAIASSDPTCTYSVNFTVVDSGTLPLYPFTVSICQGDSTQPIYLPPVGDSAVITWYNAQNDLLSSPPVPNTSIVDTDIYYVSERYKECASSQVIVTAVVHPLPVAAVINTPPTICIGDTVYLQASGGVQYVWSPQDNILTDQYGKIFTRVTVPDTFTVYITDRYGCTDSASVTYSDIQPCCNFGYPNAFTPNGDGKNDGFRIVTYGNMIHYQLSIYNRYGQLVFETVDPREYWDGKFLGIPCDLGTYFYYFKGTCLTGHTEEHKGDVTLIR